MLILSSAKIADLGVDSHAASATFTVYPANWEGLPFDQLKAIKERVGDLPLVPSRWHRHSCRENLRLSLCGI